MVNVNTVLNAVSISKGHYSQSCPSVLTPGISGALHMAAERLVRVTFMELVSVRDETGVQILALYEQSFASPIRSVQNQGCFPDSVK